jgi:hypothetical protein
VSPFLDRSKRAGRWLEWKVRLFAVAAVLAMCGIYFEERWMTLLALVVLLGTMSFRFLGERDSAGDADEEDAEGA